MNKEQTDVIDFMRKAGQVCPPFPVVPPDDVQNLRLKLIYEEGIIELHDAFEQEDLVKIADAITDLLVVAYGAAVACGIDIQPCWDEVHRSNMSKFIDGHMREDGKWIKGPSYSPADLRRVIDIQMAKTAN